MLTNPNECNSTLTSVTRGSYPCPDTYIYIYKSSLVVWNLGSPLQLAVQLIFFSNLVLVRFGRPLYITFSVLCLGKGFRGDGRGTPFLLKLV